MGEGGLQHQVSFLVLGGPLDNQSSHNVSQTSLHFNQHFSSKTFHLVTLNVTTFVVSIHWSIKG